MLPNVLRTIVERALSIHVPTQVCVDTLAVSADDCFGCDGPAGGKGPEYGLRHCIHSEQRVTRANVGFASLQGNASFLERMAAARGGGKANEQIQPCCRTLCMVDAKAEELNHPTMSERKQITHVWRKSWGCICPTSHFKFVHKRPCWLQWR